MNRPTQSSEGNRGKIVLVLNNQSHTKVYDLLYKLYQSSLRTSLAMKYFNNQLFANRKIKPFSPYFSGSSKVEINLPLLQNYR